MKLYEQVEFLDIEREYFDSKSNYIDTVTVRYEPWEEDFKINVHHIENKDYIGIDIIHLSNNRETEVITGGLKDIKDFYKQTAKRWEEDSDNEIEAALVGFYIFKLPKKVRDVKVLKLDKETEDTWGDIVSEL